MYMVLIKVYYNIYICCISTIDILLIQCRMYRVVQGRRVQLKYNYGDAREVREN